MEEYNIYCTEEQTKKALELGAPIGNRVSFISGEHYIYERVTAEQLRNWMEDVFCLRFYCGEDSDGFIFVNIYSPQELIATVEGCGSPIYATHAAIDAALDYLSKDKK